MTAAERLRAWVRLRWAALQAAGNAPAAAATVLRVPDQSGPAGATAPRIVGGGSDREEEEEEERTGSGLSSGNLSAALPSEVTASAVASASPPQSAPAAPIGTIRGSGGTESVGNRVGGLLGRLAASWSPRHSGGAGGSSSSSGGLYQRVEADAGGGGDDADEEEEEGGRRQGPGSRVLVAPGPHV